MNFESDVSKTQDDSCGYHRVGPESKVNFNLTADWSSHESRDSKFQEVSQMYQCNNGAQNRGNRIEIGSIPVLEKKYPESQHLQKEKIRNFQFHLGTEEPSVYNAKKSLNELSEVLHNTDRKVFNAKSKDKKNSCHKNNHQSGLGKIDKGWEVEEEQDLTPRKNHKSKPKSICHRKLVGVTDMSNPAKTIRSFVDHIKYNKNNVSVHSAKKKIIPKNALLDSYPTFREDSQTNDLIFGIQDHLLQKNEIRKKNYQCIDGQIQEKYQHSLRPDEKFTKTLDRVQIKDLSFQRGIMKNIYGKTTNEAQSSQMDLQKTQKIEIIEKTQNVPQLMNKTFSNAYSSKKKSSTDLLKQGQKFVRDDDFIKNTSQPKPIVEKKTEFVSFLKKQKSEKPERNGNCILYLRSNRQKHKTATEPSIYNEERQKSCGLKIQRLHTSYKRGQTSWYQRKDLRKDKMTYQQKNQRQRVKKGFRKFSQNSAEHIGNGIDPGKVAHETNWGQKVQRYRGSQEFNEAQSVLQFNQNLSFTNYDVKKENLQEFILNYPNQNPMYSYGYPENEQLFFVSQRTNNGFRTKDSQKTLAANGNRKKLLSTTAPNVFVHSKGVIGGKVRKSPALKKSFENRKNMIGKSQSFSAVTDQKIRKSMHEEVKSSLSTCYVSREAKRQKQKLTDKRHRKQSSAVSFIQQGERKNPENPCCFTCTRSFRAQEDCSPRKQIKDHQNLDSGITEDYHELSTLLKTESQNVLKGELHQYLMMTSNNRKNYASSYLNYGYANYKQHNGRRNQRHS